MEKITGHQSVRGRVGAIAVMYETHWMGLGGPGSGKWTSSSISMIYYAMYWAGTPNQHHQTNRLYRRMRIGAAQREQNQRNGERFVAPGYGCVPRAEWFSRCSATVLPN